jgi:hypothetical protein
VLPRLAISRVVGARRGPHAGFGVAVERMGGCRSKDLVAARPQRCYGASGEDKASSSLETTDGDAPCRSRMT